MPALPGDMSLLLQECEWCDPGELFWVFLFILTLLLSALGLTITTAFSPETCLPQVKYA